MNLDLARWQFALTSIYHFLFVPVTIGLAFLVALLQTAWYRNGDETYRRLARYFGALLLINVAIGVVTGLIQEFEFGMNWSAYSRLVGNVFGGPLAMEGLVAFFLESTFLGHLDLRVEPALEEGPPRHHLAGGRRDDALRCLHHGGELVDAAPGRLRHEPPDGSAPAHQYLGAVHESRLHLELYPRAAGLAGHRRRADAGRGRLALATPAAGRGVPRAAVISLAVLLPAVILALFVGSELGVVEATYQPMKIAAAEAQWNTCESRCSFSIFQIGGGNNDHTPTQIIEIPGLLSILATNSPNGKVEGLTQLNARVPEGVRTGELRSHRLHSVLVHAGHGVPRHVVFVFAAWGGWLLYRRRMERAKWFLRIAPWMVILPFLINTAGWMLTENGRQPWIVQGLMKTANGVSPSVSATDIWISIIVFVAIFAVLGVADTWLMIRYSRRELGDDPLAKITSPDGDGHSPASAQLESSDEDELALVY